MPTLSIDMITSFTFTSYGAPATAALADAIAAAAAAVSADLGDELIGDIYASAEYRRAMAPVCVKRALRAAVERSG